MSIFATFKPDVMSIGYATFLSINATSVWGGIFLYLPLYCRTAFMTVLFYTVQIAFFWVMFFLAMILNWKFPNLARGSHVLLFSIPLATGPLMLISAMYITTIAPFCIVFGALLIGGGSSGFMLSWQRVFASLEGSRANISLIKGTAFSALLYFALCFIPTALTAYLIPLVLVPLAGLCLWLSSQLINHNQPMFEDIPQEHTVVYRNAIRESLPIALSIGALGFCSGAIRLIAITHQELLSSLNIFSMFALFLIIFIFYFFWRTRTLRVDLIGVFHALLLLVATCFITMPFMGNRFVDIGIGLSYACFMLACVLMMMHCGQIARDSGINPVFIFSFYGTIVYFMQMLGYLIGYISGSENVLGVQQLSLVSLVSLYALLVVALFGHRVIRLHTDRLEFLMLSPQSSHKNTSAEITLSKMIYATRPHKGSYTPQKLKEHDTSEHIQKNIHDHSISSFSGKYSEVVTSSIEDRLSKRCIQLRERYNLSTRETEVAELIARGYSGPSISEKLYISENTVRTHTKRIYIKLDIHKKQELLMLVNCLDG